ncbi:TIGR03905 family TSCPD domain-containing protein [Clostridiaceae bacterium 35-E11]
MYRYKTTGVCSKEIEFLVQDHIIKKVKFYAGCPGSLQGVSKLIEGLHIQEAIEKLQGITCGSKSTSCPDQLAKALISFQNSMA